MEVNDFLLTLVQFEINPAEMAGWMAKRGNPLRIIHLPLIYEQRTEHQGVNLTVQDVIR